MYKGFFYQTNFDFKRFLKLLPYKKNIILDYGCGSGIFSNKFLKSKKIKLIYMIDKNKNLKLHICDKYKKNKKVLWADTINKKKYDVVLLNSVSQYLSFYEYKKLINFFYSKRIKKIIISDIPKFPRFIEVFILMITSPKELVMGLSYIINKNYIKMGYFYKNRSQIMLKNSNYFFKFEKNLASNIFSRYTLIIQKK